MRPILRRVRRIVPAALATAVLLCATPAVGAGEDAVPPGFWLEDGDSVLFVGDSITQAGGYVECIEAWLLTRFPRARFRIANAGLSSETVAGTSEPDHHPPRPCLHDRFARDVAARRPDAVVACYGMNDGIYRLFDERIFRLYRAGVRLLADRVREGAGARLTLITPPPFDPHRRRAADPEAEHWGYKYPAVDYDATLTRYAAWLRSLEPPADAARRRLRVVSVHRRLGRHLAARRRKRVSFHLAADGVHPGPLGHWLMAQSVLEAWGAPRVRAEASVDAATARPLAGAVDEVRARDGGGVAFAWTAPLPMPRDERWDSASLALEGVGERFDRYRLQVTGLAGGTWRVIAGGVRAGDVTAGELARGVDAAGLPGWPGSGTARRVLELVREKRRLVDGAWRRSVRSPGDDTAAALREAEERAAEIGERARALCAPREVRVEVVRAPAD